MSRPCINSCAAALLCFAGSAAALTVPSNATRPPVVLLNGWETGITNSCPVSSGAAATFGNLPAYLLADGVPAVYFFDNCAQDPNQPIETLGNDFGKFLNTITYDNGQQVPQIDVVAFSMGGLIVRAYLAGLQANGALTPPANPLVHNLVLIATPNFGSFLAANFTTNSSGNAERRDGSGQLIPVESGDMEPARRRSPRRQCDRRHRQRGLVHFRSDGRLARQCERRCCISGQRRRSDLSRSRPRITRIVPYCHVDPGSFTNPTFGPLNCSGTGIANVTDESQLTGQIVRSFLAGTTAWQSIGSTPATDPYLSIDGGTFFAMVNEMGNYVTDMTQVEWGTLSLQAGGDAGTIFFNDFVAGTGDFEAFSQSLGTINCGTVTEAVGYFAAARCKLDTAIISIGPLSNMPGRVINAGSRDHAYRRRLRIPLQWLQSYGHPGWRHGRVAHRLSVERHVDYCPAAGESDGSGYDFRVVGDGERFHHGHSGNVGNHHCARRRVCSLRPEWAARIPRLNRLRSRTQAAGTLAWTASAAAATGSWLSVSPASGTAPSALSIAVNAAGLAAGTYQGTVQIKSAGASNSPLTIGVTLTVAAAPPTLTVSPAIPQLPVHRRRHGSGCPEHLDRERGRRIASHGRLRRATSGSVRRMRPARLQLSWQFP